MALRPAGFPPGEAGAPGETGRAAPARPGPSPLPRPPPRARCRGGIRGQGRPARREDGGGGPPGPGPPQGPRGPQGPRRPQDPRGLHDPRGLQDPRRFQRPLPPEYEPVHHEPRYDDPRPQGQGRPEDSLWRRTQRVSRPEVGGWHLGQPARASYDEDPRVPVGDEFYPQDHQESHPRDHQGFYPQDQYGSQGHYSGDGDYEDDYATGGRVVPGFGDDGDTEGGGGRPGLGAPGGRGKATPPRGRRTWQRTLLWLTPPAPLPVIVLPLSVG